MDQLIEIVAQAPYPFAWVKFILFVLLLGLVYFWCIDIYAKIGIRKAQKVVDTLRTLTESLTSENARLNKELQRYKAKYKSSQSRLRSARKMRRLKEKTVNKG